MLQALKRISLFAAIVAIITSGFPTIAYAETNQSPLFTSTPPGSTITAGTEFSYQAAAPDPEGNPVVFSFAASHSGMSLTSDGLFTFAPTKAGTYKGRILATDSFGGVASQDISITVTPATFTKLSVVPSEASVNAGQTQAFAVYAADIFGNATNVSATSSASIPAAAEGTMTGLSYTAKIAGSWQVTFSYGALTVQASLFVAPDTATDLIASIPESPVKAGDEIAVQATLRDAYGNSWDASHSISVSSDEPNAQINQVTYTPKKKGSWKINAQLADKKSEISASVIPANPFVATIEPADPLMSIENGTQKQFNVRVTDRFGNDITDLPMSWDVNASIGTITPDGLFSAKQTGSGTVSVQVGLLGAEKRISVIPESSGSSNAVARSQQSAGQVKGETAEIAPKEESADSTTRSGETSNDANSCINPTLWLSFGLYAAYLVVMAGYFLAIRKEQDASWWIFPVLLTAIGIIVYVKYFCGAYSWWPWVLVILGLLETAAFRRKRTPPPQQTQQPLF